MLGDDVSTGHGGRGRPRGRRRERDRTAHRADLHGPRADAVPEPGGRSEHRLARDARRSPGTRLRPGPLLDEGDALAPFREPAMRQAPPPSRPRGSRRRRCPRLESSASSAAHASARGAAPRIACPRSAGALARHRRRLAPSRHACYDRGAGSGGRHVMTERKPPDRNWKTSVEEQIQDAQREGGSTASRARAGPSPASRRRTTRCGGSRSSSSARSSRCCPRPSRFAPDRPHAGRGLDPSREDHVVERVAAINAEIARANRTAAAGPPTTLSPLDRGILEDRAVARRPAAGPPGPRADPERRRPLTWLTTS